MNRPVLKRLRIGFLNALQIMDEHFRSKISVHHICCCSIKNCCFSYKLQGYIAARLQQGMINTTRMTYVVYGAGKSFNVAASTRVYISRLPVPYDVIHRILLLVSFCYGQIYKSRILGFLCFSWKFIIQFRTGQNLIRSSTATADHQQLRDLLQSQNGSSLRIYWTERFPFRIKFKALFYMSANLQTDKKC